MAEATDQTEEEKDKAFLGEFYAKEDKMCGRTYATRGSAIRALRDRYFLDVENGPYAVEQQGDGRFMIVPDADRFIRDKQHAEPVSAKLNSIFAGSSSASRRPRKSRQGKYFDTRKVSSRPLDRPKGAVDCTYGPHNNWGKDRKQ